MIHSGDVLAAIDSGNLELLKQLVERDRSAASARDSSGVSALMNSLYRGRQDMVALLLGAGDAIGAAVARRQQGSARQLLGAGADPAAVARNKMKVQPLHSAAAARQHGIAEMLLHAGAPVDARQQGGWTALHAAAQHGDVQTAELLLEYGADPAITNDDGKTPSDMAAEHPDLARMLASARPRRQTAS